MSKSNENNPHQIIIPLGSFSSATVSVPGGYNRKAMKIRQVALLNGLTGATATTTLKATLKNGTTAIAEVSSAAADEGAITPLVAKLASETDISVAAGSSLHVHLEAQAAGAFDDAMLVLEAYRQ